MRWERERESERGAGEKVRVVEREWERDICGRAQVCKQLVGRRKRRGNRV